MTRTSYILCVLALWHVTRLPAAAPHPAAGRGDLARSALSVLKTHCYRCHGQDGAVEGGFNHVLDPARLVARRKIILGDPARSPLFAKVIAGKMPPTSVKDRPSPADIAILRRWIASGAPGVTTSAPRKLVSETEVLQWILSDLEKSDRRARRFVRYFSLVPLYNAGHSDDELRTYRNALAKLINSLSWHPRISIPQAIDSTGLVLRIDLRDYLLDANLWNRVLAEYPYGVAQDTGVARAVLVATATRMPVVRADWFIATASRAPLYYEILQMPSNLADLERQLRVDVEFNIRQERVARAGFNGSGISRNNRVLERHDAMNGAYRRTYDFDAVPQNLIERNILLPDQRNLFAYPLGPGRGDDGFRHAGGEAIFNLPNGLQGYILVNANNERINKGPTAIVSDPKRPDRAVEAGLSCMHCHARGIIQKDDQIREHVRKNAKAFKRADAELVAALYPPAKKMRQLMSEDAKRFQTALAKTGNKADAAEVVLAMTVRYEADVDLPTLAAELGVTPARLIPKLTATENLTRNVGALRVEGATVARQVVVQAFADLVGALKLGTAIEPGRTGESLPDLTGEADPLEVQSSPANAAAISPDGTLAAFASADRSVRIHDIERRRNLRACIGHTASVWCVAFSPDGKRLISGGKDDTLRLWDVATGEELRVITEAHVDLVSAVAFSPDGKRVLSAGYDHEVHLWDAERGEKVRGFAFTGARYVHAVTFSPDGKRAVIGSGKVGHLVDADTGKLIRKLEGHAGWITSATFSADGKHVLTASDDGTARLWDVQTGKTIREYGGHVGPVKSIALDATRVITAGSDSTVRLHDLATGNAGRVFARHTAPLVAVALSPTGDRTLSVSRDATALPWQIGKPAPVKPVIPPTNTQTELKSLRPVATVSVGGTVGSFILSPDRKWLYFLDRSNARVGRLTLATMKLDEVPVLEGTATLALTPNGKLLVAPWAGPKGKFHLGQLQLIGTAPFEKRDHIELLVRVHDIAVSDSAAYVSLIGSDWTSLAAVPLVKGGEVRNLGTVWGGSLLKLSPDGKRLFASSRGVTPGTLKAFSLSAKVAPTDAPNRDKVALGGEFIATPDGKHLILRTGTVLRLSADAGEDMKPHARIEPHLSAAVDVTRRSVWLAARDGTLRRYSYPEFRLETRVRPTLAAYRVAVDGKAGRLYVAGFDPRSMADRPRAKGHGDIHVYDLKELSTR